jgi:tRNA(Ile)-lysidine synthase
LQGVTPQNRHVTSLAEQFLNVHWDQKRPLLLGYSGGPDSKALLYALIECGVKPHIAHVDHGWREESREEADCLKKEAEHLNCPFFTIRLNIEKTEDAARKARLTFFSSLMDNYAALLLAHQADDLAETVLKRILEGAHLPHLGGMEPVSEQNGMKIWRPLLNVRRSEILQFLNDRSLTPLIDSSNFDPAYLRARMRSEIFPFLNQAFGKETTENLTLLSERAYELKQYLDRQVASAPIYQGPWGTLVDLSGLETIEQRHLLQKIGKPLSRDHLETLLQWLKNGAKSKQLILKTKKILVDGGRVCIISLSPKD